MRRIPLAIALFALLAVPAGAQELYVVHGINGSDLGLTSALPVDVSVGGGCLLEDFRFGSIEGPVPVDPGLYRVEIRLADPTNPCGGTLVLARDVSVALGESAAIVAHLTEEAVVAATKFRNDSRAVGDDETRVIVRHAAAAPAVDVLAQQASQAPFVAFAGLESGDQGLAVLPAVQTTVALAAAGTHDIVFGPISGLPDGRSNTIVYAVGSLDSGTFTLLSQVISLP
ncbi:MAG: DUF4397 domain-containing protein [Acidobacteriota bacterium]|jgi:hypothetical protein